MSDKTSQIEDEQYLIECPECGSTAVVIDAPLIDENKESSGYLYQCGHCGCSFKAW